MILQALKEYGERSAPSAEDGVVSDAFADDVKIHWLLEIDSEGNFVNLVYRGVEQRDEKGKKKPEDAFQPILRVPKEVSNSRSSGGNPQFLADNLEYYFGISDSDLGKKDLDSHLALVSEFANAYLGDERAVATKKFFDRLVNGEIKATWDGNANAGKGKLVISTPSEERRYAVKKPKERIALCLKQDNLQPIFHTCHNLRLFWSKHFRAINQKRQKAGVQSPCICCGEPKPVFDTFDQFDGLPGGKTYLLCYGKDAFHSYGFQDGENASLCFDCMKAVIRGMNALLKSPSTHKLIRYGKPKPDETEKIPPVMFAFWCKEPVEFDFGKVSDADTESVKNILESVRRGVRCN